MPPTEPICLTPEEVEGLRELLAWVATIEERGFRDDEHLLRVTAETWRDMTAGPKRKLSRLTSRRMLEESHATED